MSTAWRGDLVIWREPASALALRIGRRSLVPALAIVAWLLATPTWFSVTLTVLAVIPALLVVLAVVNATMNRGVILVHRASGAIEWPRSVQEMVLGREVEHVAGPEIAVQLAPAVPMGTAAEPRVDLSAGQTRIPRVPLHGTSPADFVALVNGRLEGRGTRLELVEAAADPDPS